MEQEQKKRSLGPVLAVILLVVLLVVIYQRVDSQVIETGQDTTALSDMNLTVEPLQNISDNTTHQNISEKNASRPASAPEDTRNITDSQEESLKSLFNSTSNASCKRNFLITAPEHNVNIQINKDSGKIDVLYQYELTDEVVCQNGSRVKTKKDCLPEGLLEFLNEKIKVRDILHFRCSTGKITDNPEDCLPAFATRPPEEYLTMKCRYSNNTIDDISCRDLCYAARVRWFFNNIGNNSSSTENSESSFIS